MIEAGELWSYVGTKREVGWVWVALDKDTRQVVAMVCGDRSERTARCLWDALPDAYRAVVTEDRHAAAGKEAGLTNHVERFWLTVRQRCGRFVRKTLSFSRCPLNHVGFLWDFIRHYNASLL